MSKKPDIKALAGDGRVDDIIVALGNDKVRGKAVKALGDMGDPKAVDPLIDCLGDDKPSVREKAAEALGAIGDPRAVEPLIHCLNQCLSEADVLVRAKAAEALSAIGDRRAVEPLVERLKDVHPLVRSEAVKALGLLGDPKAMDSLTLVLSDKEGFVRTAAEESLVALREKAAKASRNRGDPTAVDSLLEALHDENAALRAGAAEALGDLGDPGAVDPLMDCLKDGDLHVRVKAVEALGKLGDPKAADALKRLLTGHILVRKEAEDALHQLGCESARSMSVGKTRRLVRELCQAATSGDTAKVQRLIDEGADVDGGASDVGGGSTALHCALLTRRASQKSDLVRLLIDNGADVNVRTERGESEEARAKRWVNVDVLEGVRMVSKLIIGDISPAASIGVAPLDMAAAQDESDIAQLLIDGGADVNAQGENAETALHITAVHGAYATAKVLIEAGADTTTRTEGKKGETAWGGLTSGGTPLEWALRRLEQATLPQKSRARMEATAELLRSAGGTTE